MCLQHITIQILCNWLEWFIIYCHNTTIFCAVTVTDWWQCFSYLNCLVAMLVHLKCTKLEVFQWNNIHIMRFEISTVARVQIVVLSAGILDSLVGSHQHTRGTCCIHFQQVSIYDTVVHNWIMEWTDTKWRLVIGFQREKRVPLGPTTGTRGCTSTCTGMKFIISKHKDRIYYKSALLGSQNCSVRYLPACEVSVDLSIPSTHDCKPLPVPSVS